MKYLQLIFAFAGAAVAQPAFSLTLAMMGNSRIQATLTNEGSEPVMVLNADGLLSEYPVQKVHVTSEGMPSTNSTPIPPPHIISLIYCQSCYRFTNTDSETGANIPFEGLRGYLDRDLLLPSDFTAILPNQSEEILFDLAETFNLTQGGRFLVQSRMNLDYALDGNITNLAIYPLESNTVIAGVDGAEASLILTSFRSAHQKRANVNSNCSGVQRSAVEASVKHTHSMAVEAAKAAKSGPAKKMEEYFKRTDDNTRNIVAGVFEKMTKVYAGGGRPNLHCKDIHGYCGRWVAYCVFAPSDIVFCNPWFQRFQEIDKTCRKVDQAFVALHEATHLNEVKNTDDYGVYGYDGLRRLTADKNINHADTYSYFAHDVLAGC